MSKENKIIFKGVVTQVFNTQEYEVEFENGHKVMAHVAGKMKLHRIKIIVGDHVQVELSGYDLSKGRIIYRYK